MTFKERLLEGETWDKVKEFAGDNKVLSAGIGGAGLGALYNFASSGADDMAAGRAEDMDEWLGDKAQRVLSSERVMDKDAYTDVRDQYIDSQRNNIPGLSTLNKMGDWVTGNKEDFDFGQNAEHANSQLQNFIVNNPDHNIEMQSDPTTGKPTSLSIGGHHVSDKTHGFFPSRSDTDYQAYTDSQQLKKFVSPEEAKGQILSSGTKDLKNVLADKEQHVADSTSDSYRNTVLGGAALGAGGTYAARKLKEKQGY